MVETKDFLRVKITFGIYQKYIFLPLFISINHKSLTYSINHLKWVRIKNFFNNSYALNKPYRGPLFQKRINHTHLIRKKRRTFFPKKNKPYVWLIRHRRVGGRNSILKDVTNYFSAQLQNTFTWDFIQNPMVTEGEIESIP